MTTCPHCSRTFMPARPWQRYCSAACQVKAKNDRKPRKGAWRWGDGKRRARWVPS